MPNVTIQLVPYSVGQYDALGIGGITSMSYPWVGASVFVQSHREVDLLEHAAEVDLALAAFDHASGLALSPEDSQALVAEAADRWTHGTQRR